MSFNDNFFSADHNQYTPAALTKAGRGFMRVVLLFGSAAVALGLIVVPVLYDQANKVAAQSVLPDGLDRTMTGSVKRDAGAAAAAHQPAPLCVIEADGSRHGDC